MSTKATVHFNYGDKTRAIIYRHSDGYPDGLGKDLERFLDDVSKLNDTRFRDPSYLAAKFVVWQANEYADKDNRLNFLSLGVCIDDPGDIEYVYILDCSSDKRPEVKCKRI